MAYKPPFKSSNHFLSSIKRRYNVKKAGFSGTLDPFAKGVLIIAFGQYTKLFRFLKKTPKKYRATLWLGAVSQTLDIEKIEQIEEVSPLNSHEIAKVMQSFLGEITYLPPKYSAKKIDGKRAYALARNDKEFELKAIKSTIYDIKLLNYSHPFVSFEIEVSEGAYIRSIAHLIAQKLGLDGSLSSLERLNEGKFFYDDEKALRVEDYIDLKKNNYLGDIEDVLLGRVLNVENFEIKDDGEYLLKFNNILCIISIKEDIVTYILNRIELC